MLSFLDPITDGDVIDNLVMRLKHSKTVIDDNKVRTERFVRCTCSRYMNYAWCLHACVWAVHKGIIVGVPHGYKERAADLIGVLQGGRPEKAVHGGALGTK